MGTKTAAWADENNSEIKSSTGIYKGIVKQIDTGTRTGRVYVYIDGFGGDNADVQANWQIVSYASPFGGFTTGLLNQTGNSIEARNDFTGTQQSYGFTVPAPDVGSQVLCCFPNGDKSEGYWFACINPNLSQYMMPAIGAVTLDKIDPLSIPSFLTSVLTPGFSYPCGEFNQLDKKVYNSNWSNSLRPLHVPQTIKLINQGLDGDPLRGAISSSQQRDPISSVLGFSTPGRPLGGQDPANNPNLREALRTGNFNAADYIVSNRVGGHSLVMDDGDIYGKDNLVRLKTAAGHQILMNDAEGFMYIANAAGTAWVELTKGGDILVFSQKNLSIRTMGDLMLHSDRNINLNARGNLNFNAGLAVRLQGQYVEAVGRQVLNLYGQQAQVGGASTLALRSGGGMGIQSGGGIGIKGSRIDLNGQGGSTGAIATPGGIPQYLLPDAAYVGQKWGVQPNSFTSINPIVPTHEPYIRGSVAAVVAQQEALADELSKLSTADTTTDINGNYIQPPTIESTKGGDAASNQSVTGAAPTSAYVKQPAPRAGIGSLDQNEVQAFMAQMAYSESRGQYIPINKDSPVEGTNQYGYVGKYQLGSAALQDLGYLKPGTPQTPEAMNNPNNWLGGNGKPENLQDFLNSPVTQEDAYYRYTQKNYAALQRNGLITDTTPNDVQAGLLAAAALVGPGGPGTTKGVYNWYVNGAPAADANGSTAETYYNRGVYSQTQVPVVQSSNNSKAITKKA